MRKAQENSVKAGVEENRHHQLAKEAMKESAAMLHVLGPRSNKNVEGALRKLRQTRDGWKPKRLAANAEIKTLKAQRKAAEVRQSQLTMLESSLRNERSRLEEL
eukprot:2471450-Pleurochrysis_carterae.AAC.1